MVSINNSAGFSGGPDELFFMDYDDFYIIKTAYIEWKKQMKQTGERAKAESTFFERVHREVNNSRWQFVRMLMSIFVQQKILTSIFESRNRTSRRRNGITNSTGFGLSTQMGLARMKHGLQRLPTKLAL